MKRDNVNYLLVGSFVLLILLTFLWVVAKITHHQGKVAYYYAYYQNVTGLKYGTPISYQGFQIGQVEEICPFWEVDSGRCSGSQVQQQQPSQAIKYRVNISVRADWKIPSDSIAYITASGLLSTITINIEEGKSPTYLQAGQEIQGQELVDLIHTFSSVAQDVGALTRETIQPLLANVQQGVDHLLSQLNRSTPKILTNIEQMTTTVNQEILVDLLKAGNNIKQGSQQIKRLLQSENLDSIETSLQHIEQSSANFQQLSQQLQSSQQLLDQLLKQSNQLVADNKSNISQSTRQLNQTLKSMNLYLDNIAGNLQSASQNINEFSQQIRYNPSLLLQQQTLEDQP